MTPAGSADGPQLHFSAATPVDPTALAIAAGRLFQAITADTVKQFNRSEVMAWLAFTDALELRRFRAEEPVEDAVSLDPVRYSNGAE